MSLDTLAHEVRWVAWRSESRGGKLTKIPYAPGGGKAAADDPATWGTRTEAEATAAKIVNGLGGGVGIELGDLGGDQFLAGIDLDSCIEVVEGHNYIADWAQAIIEAAPTYGEQSPSGTGVKLFALIGAEDVRPFLNAIGVLPESWGCRRSVPGHDGSNHGPAVEVYCAGRYFAVTGKPLESSPVGVMLWDRPVLDRLVDLVPPPRTNSAIGASEGDGSRSAKAFRKGAALRRAGKTFDEMVEALRSDPKTADWVREKGMAFGQRELRRIWEKVTPPGDDVEGPRPPLYSDDDIALRFSAKHSGELRYVALWGKWLLWDGTRWKVDEILKSFSFSRVVCRGAAAEITDPKYLKTAVAIASNKTIAAVVSLARSDARHAATVNQWDCDLDAINTPYGTIHGDGVVYQHRREDYITKSTAVVAGGECPLWRSFLEKITAGNKELQLYLQRVAGYCLTGSTKEQVLFFLYGTGGNGKGVFIRTLAAIWGDYAAVASMDTFIETNNERHPTELAFLRGARLVTAQETEQGRRWAESKIKALTGGDDITARFMRQDFFTFAPQFKLLIAGNHKPSLRGVDEATRRRFNLVPFTVTIPADDRDPDLPERLLAEGGGILQWALDGLVEYRSIGLAPPEAVVEATAAYLAAEDVFTRWLDECCVTSGKNASCTSKDLWESWKAYADAGNERAGNRKSFSQLLENHGFMQRRDGKSRMYSGIVLASSGGQAGMSS